MCCFDCVSIKKKGKCVLVGEEINRQQLLDLIVKTAIEEKKNRDLVTSFPSKLHFISKIFLTEL